LATWLAEKGDGLRSVIKKLNKIKAEESKRIASPGISLRKSIQRYDCPQVLVEEIVKKADEKERKKLKKILDNLELKSKLYRRINKYTKQQYSEKINSMLLRSDIQWGIY